MNVRIIPRLEIKGSNLVKGKSFEGLRVLGKPWIYADSYYKDGADEIIYQDAVASLYGRNSLFNLVETTSQSIHIPLTVGGGLRCPSDIIEVLARGADKASINSAAIENPNLVEQLATKFGSSTIVITIEASFDRESNQWKAMYNFGRERSANIVLDWARQVERMGAGEINLIVVELDGWGKGAQLDLAQSLTEEINIPIIIGGGIGTIEDVVKVFTNTKASAVSISSAFHYHYLKQVINRTKLENYEEEGNISYLTTLNSNFDTTGFSLRSLKKELLARGIPVSLRDE